MPKRYFRTTKSTKPLTREPMRMLSMLNPVEPAIDEKNSIVFNEMKKITSSRPFIKKKSISKIMVKGFDIYFYFVIEIKKDTFTTK